MANDLRERLRRAEFEAASQRNRLAGLGPGVTSGGSDESVTRTVKVIVEWLRAEAVSLRSSEPQASGSIRAYLEAGAHRLESLARAIESDRTESEASDA